MKLSEISHAINIVHDGCRYIVAAAAQTSSVAAEGS